jgi:hypothetical protein
MLLRHWLTVEPLAAFRDAAAAGAPWIWCCYASSVQPLLLQIICKSKALHELPYTTLSLCIVTTSDPPWLLHFCCTPGNQQGRPAYIRPLLLLLLLSAVSGTVLQACDLSCLRGHYCCSGCQQRL